MVISFFEAIAWFIPLVGVILIIYFPVAWNQKYVRKPALGG